MAFPKTVNLFSFAKKNYAFEGSFNLAGYAQKMGAIDQQQNKVNTVFSMYLEKKLIPIIKGSVSTCIRINCQRCLGEVELPLNSHFKVAFITEDQTSLVDEEFETLMYQEDISMKDFLIDELLLSMPIRVRHSHDCAIDYHPTEQQPIDDRVSPFSSLNTLKQH